MTFLISKDQKVKIQNPWDFNPLFLDAEKTVNKHLFCWIKDWNVQTIQHYTR